jgi:hypothetical protein
MLVFWEQKIVLLATPKTGSTALAVALDSLSSLSVQRPPVLKHTNVHRYHRFVGPYLAAASGDRFTLIAVMREPCDWLGSWYRFRQRDDLHDSAKSTAAISFDDFVRAYCTNPQPEFAAVGAQGRFLRPHHGEGVDYLFRYDDMGRLVTFLENRLDYAIVLPRVNVSPVASLELRRETTRLLQNTLVEDFTLYSSLADK